MVHFTMQCSVPYTACLLENEISTSYTYSILPGGGRRGRDRMVVGFTTTSAISADHH